LAGTKERYFNVVDVRVTRLAVDFEKKRKVDRERQGSSVRKILVVLLVE
jgi:hypothetical protein